MIGTGNQHASELTVSAGRWLDADSLKSRDLGEHFLKLVHELERTLDGFLTLTRMDLGETGIAGNCLIDFRVVLHRARTERIKVDVDRVILLASSGVVANDVDF